MPSGTQAAPVSKKILWAGWITSALPVLMLLFSGVMKLVKPAPLVEGFARFGYPESLALGIGIVELACTVIYFHAFPIQDDDHLIAVLRDVECNPVRAQLIARAEDWAWSSLPGWLQNNPFLWRGDPPVRDAR